MIKVKYTITGDLPLLALSVQSRGDALAVHMIMIAQSALKEVVDEYRRQFPMALDPNNERRATMRILTECQESLAELFDNIKDVPDGPPIVGRA